MGRRGQNTPSSLVPRHPLPLYNKRPRTQLLRIRPGCTLAQGPVDLIRQQIQAAEARLSAIRGELESVEESIEIQSFGFYRPRYGFQSSDKYSERRFASSKSRSSSRSKRRFATPSGLSVAVRLKGAR
jgi:hypothetical protein